MKIIKLKKILNIICKIFLKYNLYTKRVHWFLFIPTYYNIVFIELLFILRFIQRNIVYVVFYLS